MIKYNDLSKYVTDVYLGNNHISEVHIGAYKVFPDSEPPTPPTPYENEYFTMVVATGGNIKFSGSTSTNRLYYSKDNGQTWTSANSATTISVNAGDKVLWKGTPTPTSNNNGIGKFSGSTNVRYSVEGNAMSLLFGDNFIGQTSLEGKNNALAGLFHGIGTVTSAENLVLPATTLARGCYWEMFSHCLNLTTAPKLPATTLAYHCYEEMFMNCTGLTSAPVLPATTLANSCYKYMFSGCKSLTSAPALPATTLVTSCYESMFEGCTGLTTVPALPATTLDSYCYYCMFRGCTSLTTAPELPATTLANYCYYYMFSDCTSLNYIKCIATDISATNCTANWVDGVAASGTFVKAASMTGWTTGVNGIPNGWTIQDAS